MKLANIEVGQDYAVQPHGVGRPRRGRVVGFDKVDIGGRYSNRRVTQALINFVNDDGSLQLAEQETRLCQAGEPFIGALESRSFLHPWAVEEKEIAEREERDRARAHARALQGWAEGLLATAGFDLERDHTLRYDLLQLRFGNQDELLRLAEFVAKHSGVEIPPRPTIKEGTTNV